MCERVCLCAYKDFYHDILLFSIDMDERQAGMAGRRQLYQIISKLNDKV